jgi:nitrite reductase (NO-forming)
MRKLSYLVLIGLVLASLLVACSGNVQNAGGNGYVLTTGLKDGKLVFIGVGNTIADVVDPVLKAQPGETLTITLINGEGAEHDIFFPDLDAKTGRLLGSGKSAKVTFTVPNRDVALVYYDSVPGHAEAGMKGYLLVGNATAPEEETTISMPMGSVKETGVTVSYTLETGLQDGKMVYIGKGGDIDGKLNPDLKANLGDKVKLTLISGEGAEHNFVLDELGVNSQHVSGKGTSIEVEFNVNQEGTFAYYCSLPGHRQAGMEGKFIAGSGSAAGSSTSYTGGGSPAPTVVEAAGPADPNAVDIVRDPTDIPAPIGNRAATNLRVDLETEEVSGVLADGSTYTYWTFNGKVPGPFIRVRVGDSVEVHLKNNAGSTMMHSVDFHAVTGPGGGAVMTQTAPGEETMFTFKALNPGLYVYHCATPMVADHISNGMYGLILVEPQGGLPKVDREFYVMQGEIYTTQPFGTKGALTNDTTKLLNETPEYFVFNGMAGALTTDAHQLNAKVGETVRIFFGVGGPNFTSSFHVIGEIFDRVYEKASLTSKPLTDVQTTTVPPGGATMVEFKLQVPGRYILVDHALSRMQRGLAGYLIAEGDPNPDVFNGTVSPGSGH